MPKQYTEFTIEKYTFYHLNGRWFLENEHGEEMEFAIGKLVKLLDEFWEKEFL